MAKDRFSISLEAFKGGFVDKKIMLSVASAKQRAYLQAGGELTRRVVSRTLKKAKSTAISATFARQNAWPPRRRDGKPTRRYASNPAPAFPAVRMKIGDKTNKANIAWPLYALNSQTRPTEVVIGPAKLIANPVPRILERGGTIRTKTRRRNRKVGDGGEIRVDRGRQTKSGKVRFAKRTSTAVKTNTDYGVATVVYAKIRTANQARRATEINHSLYKPSRTLSVPGRRYMRQILRMVTTLPTNRQEWERKAKALFNGYISATRRSLRQSSSARRA
jgi:hypothetical protein